MSDKDDLATAIHYLRTAIEHLDDGSAWADESEELLAMKECVARYETAPSKEKP